MSPEQIAIKKDLLSEIIVSLDIMGDPSCREGGTPQYDSAVVVREVSGLSSIEHT